jgi:hypothetical protein
LSSEVWTDPTGAPELPPGYIWAGWNRKKTVNGINRQVLSKLPAGSTHAPHPSLVKGFQQFKKIVPRRATNGKGMP